MGNRLRLRIPGILLVASWAPVVSRKAATPKKKAVSTHVETAFFTSVASRLLRLLRLTSGALTALLLLGRVHLVLRRLPLERPALFLRTRHRIRHYTQRRGGHLPPRGSTRLRVHRVSRSRRIRRDELHEYLAVLHHPHLVSGAFFNGRCAVLQVRHFALHAFVTQFQVGVFLCLVD